MKKKLPIIQMDITDDLENPQGMKAVALVDEPAIEEYWLKFAKQQGQSFVTPQKGESQSDFMSRCIPILVGEGKDQDQAIAICYKYFEGEKQAMSFAKQPDKQIITGCLMVADMPIYRKDVDGTEYYVTFSKDVIGKMVKKFSKLNYFNRVNLMHDPQTVPEGIYMIELFQSDASRGVNAPDAFGKLADGSLFASYYVENPELWQFIQTDQFKGFSIEGIFGYQFAKQCNEDDELKRCISECLQIIDRIN